MTSLVVDVGKGGCRAAWVDNGQLGPVGNGPGVPHISEPDAPQAIVAAVELAADDTGRRPLVVDTVSAGVTGLMEAMGRAPKLSNLLRSGIAPRRVIVAGDVVTSHAGAFDGGPGVVIVVGTGTVALGVAPDGNHAKADGLGYILGDDGSGYAIGRQGLASALRHSDGRGGSARLAELAEQAYGSIERLAENVYAAENPPARVARFATAVADAAREGDPHALSIWDEAATSLASTAAAVAHRVFDQGRSEFALSWMGGVFDADDLLLTPFLERVTERVPKALPTPSRGGQLQGAQRLAETGHEGIHRDLIYVDESQ